MRHLVALRRERGQLRLGEDRIPTSVCSSLAPAVDAAVTVDAPQVFFVRYVQARFVFSRSRRALMPRPSAREFLQALLETLEDLPPDFARRLEEIAEKEHVDRSQAIRQLFEEFAGE